MFPCKRAAILRRLIFDINKRSLSRSSVLYGKKPIVGGFFGTWGQQDDQSMNLLDVEYPGGRILYRSVPQKPFKEVARANMYLTTFFWSWFFYHAYYYGNEVVGAEWYMPELHEFTDEDLGIPPDEAEDPEYWGEHPYLPKGIIWPQKIEKKLKDYDKP